MDEGAVSSVGDRINSGHSTGNQVADFAKTRTQTGGLASTNDAGSGGFTAMAQSGFNIFNPLAKGINDFNKNFNKVKVVFELTPEQQEELLGIALFMQQQQKLESGAQSGSLKDEDLNNLKQVKSVMDKHCSLIEKIIKIKKENSSQT